MASVYGPNSNLMKKKFGTVMLHGVKLMVVEATFHRTADALES